MGDKDSSPPGRTIGNTSEGFLNEAAEENQSVENTPRRSELVQQTPQSSPPEVANEKVRQELPKNVKVPSYAEVLSRPANRIPVEIAATTSNLKSRSTMREGAQNSPCSTNKVRFQDQYKGESSKNAEETPILTKRLPAISEESLLFQTDEQDVEMTAAESKLPSEENKVQSVTETPIPSQKLPAASNRSASRKNEPCCAQCRRKPRGKAGYAVLQPDKFLPQKSKTEQTCSQEQTLKTNKKREAIVEASHSSTSSKSFKKKKTKSSKKRLEKSFVIHTGYQPKIFYPQYYQFPLYYPNDYLQLIDLQNAMIPAPEFHVVPHPRFPMFQFNPNATEFVPQAQWHNPLPPLSTALIGNWECIREISHIRDYLNYNRDYIRSDLMAPLKYSFEKPKDDGPKCGLTRTEGRNGNTTVMNAPHSLWFFTPDGEMIVSFRKAGRNVPEKCETYLRRDELDGTIQLVLHNEMRGREMFRYYRKSYNSSFM